jgi:hypothetical protein
VGREGIDFNLLIGQGYIQKSKKYNSTLKVNEEHFRKVRLR